MLMLFNTMSLSILWMLKILSSSSKLESSLCWFWDNISNSFIMLTISISSMIMLLNKLYHKQIFILVFSLLFFFSTKNFMVFFISFEFSIIPILIIILMNGHQPERLEASMSMMIYTFTASIPLLLSFLSASKFFNSLNMMDIYISFWEVGLLMMLAFFIKLPLWGFHLWLTKAHVESPVGGSMILAAIMLKIGLYGLMRIMFMMNPIQKSNYEFFVSLSLMGMIFSSMACFTSFDFKTLIAYSSILHMSPILLNLMNFNHLGTLSVLITGLSHAYSSSLLFFLSNLFYLSSKTRCLMSQKGNMICNSTLCAAMILSIVVNLSTPPFMTFFSEFGLFMNMFIYNSTLIVFILIVSILSSIYNFYFLTSMVFGKESFMKTMTFKAKHMTITLLHLVPLVFLIFL
uniref:NADH-ubiquinone oxidoreductase chain 4 n=1 Tax=Bryozoa sp. TaxID=2813608 RepID=A0AAU8L1A4_9BILA